MASLRKEVSIAASSDTVWDALRDIGALHTRLVPGFVTDTRLEPGARIVSFGNGQKIRERIVDVNEGDRRVVWAVTEEPFQHYNGAAQVFSEGPAHCRFVWVADLLPDELAEQVAGMMEEGLRVIKKTMENSIPSTGTVRRSSARSFELVRPDFALRARATRWRLSWRTLLSRIWRT